MKLSSYYYYYNVDFLESKKQKRILLTSLYNKYFSSHYLAKYWDPLSTFLQGLGTQPLAKMHITLQ